MKTFVGNKNTSGDVAAKNASQSPNTLPELQIFDAVLKSVKGYSLIERQVTQARNINSPRA